MRVAAGLPVLIRVTFGNNGDREYAILHDTAWAISDLRISNVGGKIVAPSKGRDPGYSMPVSIERAAGEVWALTDFTRSEYVDVSHWGYALGPGMYRICAAPRVVGFISTPDHKRRLNEFGTSGQGFGNDCAAVTITTSDVFSATPASSLYEDEITRGENVQKFSGAFVQRLSEEWSSPTRMRCLESLKKSYIRIATFASGEVIANPAGASCDMQAQSAAPNSPPTSQVSIRADRVIALTLVSRRFSREPRFGRNDRDLSHYDVELFEKGGVLTVILEPPPSDSLVAGCAPTGPISAAYLVDLQTFVVQLGNMVC